MKPERKLLNIVLDAADPDLIEKWMEDGSLPNMKALRAKGGYGRVDSVADYLSEAVPYTFFSGKNPATHGALGFATWQAETMKFVPPAGDWVSIVPFWRSFPKDGPRVIALDVSNVFGPIPFNGIEIVGFASHDTLVPFTSYPPEYKERIASKYGFSHLNDEFYGLVKKKEFLHERERTLKMLELYQQITTDLLRSEPWDYYLGYTFILHHGGHRLYTPANIIEPLTSEEKLDLETTLHRLYCEADRMIGDLLHEVGADVNIMVFSVHGMGVNCSRNWILPDMLKLILGQGNKSRIFGILERLRRLIPLRWRHNLKQKMPFRFRRSLTRYWRTGYDWSRTKAFALVSDTNGWVRINLKGREAQGIVEPQEYETLLEELRAGLQTFVDEDTGEPIIKDIVRASEVFQGENLHRLPDLIMRWSDTPSRTHRAVVSPRFGRIPWPTPGKNPEGRSGNHNPQGFLIACGPDIKQGNISNLNILDLAPTILHLLQQPIPKDMEGKVAAFARPDPSSSKTEELPNS